MSFKFYCECGQKLSATDDMIGTQAACPRCGQMILVPQPAEAGEAPPAAPIPDAPDAPVADAPPSPVPAPPPPSIPAPSIPDPSVPTAPPPPAAPAPRKKLPMPPVSRPGPRRAWILVLLTPIPWGILAALHGKNLLGSLGDLSLSRPYLILAGLAVVALLIREAARVAAGFRPPIWEMACLTIFTAGLDLLVAVPASLSVEKQIGRREIAPQHEPRASAEAAAPASAGVIVQETPEAAFGFAATLIGLAILTRCLSCSVLLRDRSGACFGLGRGTLAVLVLVVLLAPLTVAGMWLLARASG